MRMPYRHGGDIQRAAREASVAPEQILDFSSNINPMGLPVRAAERLATEAKDSSVWNRYPDPGPAGFSAAEPVRGDSTGMHGDCRRRRFC